MGLLSTEMDILWAVFHSGLLLNYMIFLSGLVDLGTGGKWKILRVCFVIQLLMCVHICQPMDIQIKQS
jgi:hypothetical protein